jgi:predicted secreted acid phosphatase
VSPHRRLLTALALVALALLVPTASAAAGTTLVGTPPAEISAYYDSGTWSKDIAAVVKKAKANLKKDLGADKPPRKPAIVLDIDETSLFNAPCMEPVDWSLAGLATCVAEGRGIATPVRDLARYAKSQRVTIAFITGRPEGVEAITRQNLGDQGYASIGKLVLKPASYTEDSLVPFKSGARAELEQQGYTILANVGDQQSDLAGGHAKRRYKLPNPIYVTS